MDPFTSTIIFEHHPLANASSQIRLLHLSSHWVYLEDGRRVPQALLVDEDRSREPTYKALSYSWGDETDTTLMLMGDLRLEIRRNLAS